MASSPENNSLIKDATKKAAGGLDNGARGARAVIEEKSKANSYEMGAYGLPEASTLGEYGDSDAIRKSYSDGAAYGAKTPNERAAIQKKLYKKK